MNRLALLAPDLFYLVGTLFILTAAQLGPHMFQLGCLCFLAGTVLNIIRKLAP